jgi:hypothetical protein
MNSSTNLMRNVFSTARHDNTQFDMHTARC